MNNDKDDLKNDLEFFLANYKLLQPRMNRKRMDAVIEDYIKEIKRIE